MIKKIHDVLFIIEKDYLALDGFLSVFIRAKLRQYSKLFIHDINQRYSLNIHQVLIDNIKEFTDRLLIFKNI